MSTSVAGVGEAPHGLGWGAKLRLVGADIKLAHSVFALPFALLAAFLVAGEREAGGIDWGRFAGQLVLVVACMFFARTWAMVVNRVADREIDAANPRTSRRAFAVGLLVRDGAAVMAGRALAFVACCSPLLGLLPTHGPSCCPGSCSHGSRSTRSRSGSRGSVMSSWAGRWRVSPIAAAIAVGRS
ncbi:MAG: UbiA family prenyltransferase [Phycisphaerales bacterium]